MKSASQASITDSQLAAVRAMAAEGRPIPDIVMKAIVARLEATMVDDVPAQAQHRPRAA